MDLDTAGRVPSVSSHHQLFHCCSLFLETGMHEDMTHSVDSRPLCLSLFGTFMLLNSMVASDIAETFPSGNEVLFGILLKFH